MCSFTTSCRTSIHMSVPVPLIIAALIQRCLNSRPGSFVARQDKAIDVELGRYCQSPWHGMQRIFCMCVPLTFVIQCVHGCGVCLELTLLSILHESQSMGLYKSCHGHPLPHWATSEATNCYNGQLRCNLLPQWAMVWPLYATMGNFLGANKCYNGQF